MSEWHLEQGGDADRRPLITQTSLSMCSSTCQPVGTSPDTAAPASRRGVGSVLWAVLGLFTLGTNRSLIAEAGGAVPRSPDSSSQFLASSVHTTSWCPPLTHHPLSLLFSWSPTCHMFVSCFLPEHSLKTTYKTD